MAFAPARALLNYLNRLDGGNKIITHKLVLQIKVDAHIVRNLN